MRGTFISTEQQFPFAITSEQEWSEDQVGKLTGTLGRYQWTFSYDLNAKHVEDYLEVVDWEWSFTVHESWGGRVYRSYAITQPLYRVLATPEYFRTRAEYQAQIFLEEHLHLRFE